MAFEIPITGSIRLAVSLGLLEVVSGTKGVLVAIVPLRPAALFELRTVCLFHVSGAVQ